MAKDKAEQLPVIKYGTIPNVLLLGNGVNKAFQKLSWDDLIKEITTIELTERECDLINKIPYPLRTVIVTKDNVDKHIERIAPKMLETELEYEQKEIISKFVNIGFDSILTTNYSYEIEKAIDESFSCKIKKNSKYRKNLSSCSKSERTLGLYRCMKVSNEESTQFVWHIHGEAALPNSIILGHYYYGKLLSKIQRYVNVVKSRYEGCNRYKRDFQPKSWIDYFLIGNVYIVGFSLDLSELDLWWLINCKKRNATEYGKIFFYEPNMYSEEQYTKKLLAEVYGMKIKTQKVDSDYKKYYFDVVEQINKDIVS